MSQLTPENYEQLALQIVESHCQISPNLEHEYGSSGRQKCLDDVVVHLTYLQQAIDNDSHELFVDYIEWAKTLYEGSNMPLSYLKESLEVISTTLQKTVGEDTAKKADAVIQSGMLALEQVTSNSHSFIDMQAPHAQLAREYLDALLNSNRAQASKMILDAVESKGVPVQDIYLNVFQPSQREVGLLWQTGKISVAQEHFCTAATQLCMSQLYRFIFQGEKNGLKAVICCAEGELHEIGVRMVADLLEMNGWDAYYLGANSPRDAVLDYIEEHAPDLIGISATISAHLPVVTNLIKQIRGKSLKRAKIIVGGYPFNVSDDLWRKVGADATASNAAAALEEARELLS